MGAPLREEDIRPSELMQRARELLEEDTRRLVADAAEFITVPCPACGGEDHDPRWHKRGMRFVTCRDCGTSFGNPRPTLERLQRYYREARYYDYWHEHIYPRSEVARREQLFRPRAERLVELVRQHGVGRGHLMEVGAGAGVFAEELTKMGQFQRVTVVETTPACADACRARGLGVIEAPIETVSVDASVNVVAAFEVLEHLHAPLSFVQACARQLADGGLVVLTCPNGQGFDVATLGELSDTVTPEHLNYFHPDSLATLCSRAGLEVLEVTTPGKLDAELVRKRALEGSLDLTGQPFLRRVLIDEWERLGAPFQRFIADHGLSGHQWVVARRSAKPGKPDAGGPQSQVTDKPAAGGH